jgi:hypothetical protein
MFLLLLNLAMAARCPDKIYAWQPTGHAYEYSYNVAKEGMFEVDEEALNDKCEFDHRVVSLKGNKYGIDAAKKVLADAEDQAEADKKAAKSVLVNKAKNGTLNNVETQELLKILSEKL